MLLSNVLIIYRIEKTKALSENNLAHKYLHPCFTKEKYNCSKPVCLKCLRALLTLDYYGKLGSFKHVFDIEKYKNNKQEYLISLISKKDHEYLKQLYELYKYTYPKEMEIAEKVLELRTKPVKREEFNLINKCYKISTDLLKINNPKQLILDFFKKQNCAYIYLEIAN